MDDFRSAARQVIVVGGGMGGLSAALRLAHAGHRVTVLEKNPLPGGKLNLHLAHHPDRPTDRPFRFDTGPSLITLPAVFEQLFADVGERLADHLTLLPLDPIARYVWADGTTLDAGKNLDAALTAFGASPADRAGFAAFIARGQRIWDLSAEMFLYHAPEQLLAAGQPFDPRRGLAMLTIPLRIGMFSRYARLVDRHVRSPRLREILYQYATYSGASPFKAPATLAVIPFAEFHFGGWYIQGGLHTLATTVARLATDRGAVIRTGCTVAEILVDAGVARGVRLADGEVIAAEAVIANSDVVYTYRNLIAPAHRPRYTDAVLDRLEPGGSGMVLLLGVEGTYPQLAHHTKFMPADYTSDLRAMFEDHNVPEDPCIYVCASTRTDTSQAPSGCENLFVLASAPAIDGRLDWRSAGGTYRDRLIHSLEYRFGLTDLSKRIVVERTFTPETLREVYNANAGSIYGIGSNSRRTAFLRPPNRDRSIRGLYFAGGATHPGGGLPLVTLSGKIAAELVTGDFAGHRGSRPRS